MAIIRVTTQVDCYQGSSTHYLVLRIPIRQGRPAERHQKAPVIPNYDLAVAPIIEALGTVLSRKPLREIEQAVNKILDGSPRRQADV